MLQRFVLSSKVTIELSPNDRFYGLADVRRNQPLLADPRYIIRPRSPLPWNLAVDDAEVKRRFFENVAPLLQGLDMAKYGIVAHGQCVAAAITNTKCDRVQLLLVPKPGVDADEAIQAVATLMYENRRTGDSYTPSLYVTQTPTLTTMCFNGCLKMPPLHISVLDPKVSLLHFLNRAALGSDGVSFDGSRVAMSAEARLATEQRLVLIHPNRHYDCYGYDLGRAFSNGYGVMITRRAVQVPRNTLQWKLPHVTFDLLSVEDDNATASRLRPVHGCPAIGGSRSWREYDFSVQNAHALANIIKTGNDTDAVFRRSFYTYNGDLAPKPDHYFCTSILRQVLEYDGFDGDAILELAMQKCRRAIFRRIPVSMMYVDTERKPQRAEDWYGVKY